MKRDVSTNHPKMPAEASDLLCSHAPCMAKVALLAHAEEDRRERRRQAGKPEELTPEELAGEEKKEEAIQAARAGPSRVTNPSPTLNAVASAAANLRKILVDQKKQHPNEDAKLKTCWSTLLR